MDKNARIFVTGHRGMVGSTIVRRLPAGGYCNLLLRTHAELDLVGQRAVFDFLAEQQPHYIFIAAAKVGGIQANNQYRADFIYENLVRDSLVKQAGYQAFDHHECSALGRHRHMATLDHKIIYAMPPHKIV